MELDGKRVLLTGASSGIGWALAKALSAAGARLVLVARREERLRQLDSELVIPADLSVPGQAERVAREAGAVDVLINNAGSGVGGSTWAVADKAEARRMFEVDFWTPLALIGALTPGIRERGGAIVNVTSIRQVMAWPSFGHSAAAQAALSQVTETLRLELDGNGVQVVEVIPGPVDTPALGASKLLPGLAESLDAIFGMGTPHELASMVVAALREGRERVFYPERTTREAYERPEELRAKIAQAVRQAGRLPDELTDTLVVGADSPLIAEAVATWEREHLG